MGPTPAKPWLPSPGGSLFRVFGDGKNGVLALSPRAGTFQLLEPQRGEPNLRLEPWAQPAML